MEHPRKGKVVNIDRRRICLLSDSPFLFSGQARVIRELGARFREAGWYVSALGWFDKITDHRRFTIPFPVFDIGDRNDRKTVVDKLFEALVREKPEVLLCLGDLFHFWELEDLRNRYNVIGNTNPVQILGYLNVDSEPLQLDFCRVIDSFDAIATTSGFGKMVLLSIPSGYSTKPDDVQTVYHGVDTSIYRPLSERPEKEMFRILVVAKNSIRKNIPLTLEAFYEFSKNKSDVRLVLVSDLHDTLAGYDLPKIFYQFPDLWRKIQIFPTLTSMAGFNDKTMSELYQAADILLTLPMCEGFGLPVIEAMASEVLVVGTGYSSIPELLGYGARGELIDPSGFVYGKYGQKMAVFDIPEVVAKLEDVYGRWKDGDWPSPKVEKARGWIEKENVSWDACFEKLSKMATDLAKKSVALSQTGSLYLPSLQYEMRAFAFHEMGKIHAKGRMCIGVARSGGYGDTLQTLPVIRGIKRKYPESDVVLIVERGADVVRWFNKDRKLVEGLIMLGTNKVSSEAIVTTFSTAFDRFYDIRYVSRVYGEPMPKFGEDLKEFYYGWAWSNSRIAALGLHAIDLTLKSTGLEDYASIKDIRVDPEVIPELTPQMQVALGPEFIVMHNEGGDLGGLKCLPSEEIAELARFIKEDLQIPVVQLGVATDRVIPGVIDLRGLQIPESAAILSRALLYVGLEGFLSHLAQSVGTRSAVWYTITPRELFFFEGDFTISREECPPCFWSPCVRFGRWWDHCQRGLPRCLNLPSIEEIKTHTASVIEVVRKERELLTQSFVGGR